VGFFYVVKITLDAIWHYFNVGVIGREATFMFDNLKYVVIFELATRIIKIKCMIESRKLGVIILS